MRASGLAQIRMVSCRSGWMTSSSVMTLLQHSHAHVVIDLQENNFKAVLESIRDLMNEETVLPEWLHDIFLGYGDPAAAQYNKLPSTMRALDFKV